MGPDAHHYLKGYFGRFWCCMTAVLGLLCSCSVSTRQALREGVSMNLSVPPDVDATVNPFFADCDSILCSCACDDPFDTRIQTDSGGVFGGKCLNTCRQRSGLLLTPQQAEEHGYFSAADSSDHWFVANVGHLDTTTNTHEFFVAMVPKDGVEDVLIQVEYAGGPWGHGQMRFVFKPDRPAVLTPQRTSSSSEDMRVQNLVLSSEALAPPDVPYKGDWGFKNVYFIANRIATLDERATTMIKVLRRQVWQFRIDFTQQQKASVLGTTFRYTTESQHNGVYHTVNNNCIHAVYEVIDEAVPIGPCRRFLRGLSSRTAFMPTTVEKQLRRRGLADDSCRLQGLEVELGWEKHVDWSAYE